MHIIFFLAVTVFALLLSTVHGGKAHAQACAVTPEVIIGLREPRQANYTAWDYVYGEKHMEQLNDAIQLPDRSVVAAGATWRKNRSREKRPLLFMLDRRDRMLWENRHEDLDETIEFKSLELLDEDAVKVFGTKGMRREDRTVWLGTYAISGEEKGRLLSEAEISDADHNLLYEDHTKPHDGEGYVLAARARDKARPGNEHGVIYRIDNAGKVLWKRSYKPGMTNRLYAVSAVTDENGMGYYIAAGSFDVDTQKRAGFVIAIDEKGRLAWAEQYPRGLYASLRAIAPVTDGDFVAVGDVDPQEGDYKQSGWIMRIETESGEVMWERYVSVDGMRVFGRGAIGYADGRIAAAMETRNLPGGDKPENAHLLTMSARGVIFRDDPFLEGRGVRVGSFKLNGKEQRFVAGSAFGSYKADDPEKTGNYETLDGWMIFAPALDPYIDPCIPRRRYNE